MVSNPSRALAVGGCITLKLVITKQDSRVWIDLKFKLESSDTFSHFVSTKMKDFVPEYGRVNL